MKKQFTTNRGRVVEYDYSEVGNEEILSKIIKWCTEEGVESSADTYYDRGEAADLMAEIIEDVLKFKYLGNDTSGV